MITDEDRREAEDNRFLQLCDAADARTVIRELQGMYTEGRLSVDDLFRLAASGVGGASKCLFMAINGEEAEWEYLDSVGAEVMARIEREVKNEIGRNLADRKEK